MGFRGGRGDSKFEATGIVIYANGRRGLRSVTTGDVGSSSHQHQPNGDTKHEHGPAGQIMSSIRSAVTRADAHLISAAGLPGATCVGKYTEVQEEGHKEEAQAADDIHSV